MTRKELESVLAEFAHIRALVVGDFCLDRWCMYDPAFACPSRETGIPRTAVTSYEVTPGGGGTVASNLSALGAGGVGIVGVTGDDANGFELERALRSRGINVRHLLRDAVRQTFTYTKLINKQTGLEDLPRIDFVNAIPPSSAAETAMVRALQESIRESDVILVADQSEIAEGAAITGQVRETLLGAASLFPEKIFVADSRAQVEKYAGLIVKPNEDEAIDAALRIMSSKRGRERSGTRPSAANSERARQTTADMLPHLSVEEAGEMLRQHLGGKQPLYVTCGAKGALLFGGPNSMEAPQLILACRNHRPVDICGAGDAFESGVALALAATRRLYGSPDYVAAAQVGHLVAAVTITKRGTGTATPAEVLALFDSAEKAGHGRA